MSKEQKPQNHFLAIFGLSAVGGILIGIFISGFDIKVTAILGIFCGFSLGLWLFLHREVRRWKT